MTLTLGAYFFFIALILAHLEIQIEGPHGWAEKLPTWRWDGPVVRRLFGKPVTGYHVCLVTCILLFLHVPQFYAGSWEREADLLAMFFFLTVTWDFLWFACNRHFGVARFRRGQIWWFPAWTLGVPRAGIVLQAGRMGIQPQHAAAYSAGGGLRRRSCCHSTSPWPLARASTREITNSKSDKRLR